MASEKQEVKPIPVTAADALALWDAGEPVPAFVVESEGLPQNVIYAAAFELIRDERSGKLSSEVRPEGMSDREADVAESIATVALAKGWAGMLKQHKHDSIAPITVQKPKAVASG